MNISTVGLWAYFISDLLWKEVLVVISHSAPSHLFLDILDNVFYWSIESGVFSEFSEKNSDSYDVSLHLYYVACLTISEKSFKNAYNQENIHYTLYEWSMIANTEHHVNSPHGVDILCSWEPKVALSEYIEMSKYLHIKNIVASKCYIVSRSDYIYAYYDIKL